MFEGVESGKSYFQNSGKVLLHFLLLLKRITLSHFWELMHFFLLLSLSHPTYTQTHTFIHHTLSRFYSLPLSLSVILKNMEFTRIQHLNNWSDMKYKKTFIFFNNS